MAVTIPTLTQLQQEIYDNLEARLGVSIPLFGKVFLRILSVVEASVIYLFYLTLAAVQKNQWPDTADQEKNGGSLERYGRVKLGRDPFPATPGEYLVSATGTATSVVNASQTFKADDNSAVPGKLFILQESFTMVTDPDTFTIVAIEGGLDSKLEIGDTLTATNPITGVDSQVTVQSEDVTPLAAEDIEDYRSKIVEAFQLEAQGGAGSDYRIWAADAQGVAKVYPYFKSGENNQINLFIEATAADSTDGKGTPTPAIKDEVESVVEFDPDTTKILNLRGRRPLTVNQVFYLDVTPKDVDFVIGGFIGLDADTTTAISNALTSLCESIRPFVASVDIEANRNDKLSINKAIATVQDVLKAGQSFDTLTIEVDSVAVPISEQFTDGDLPHYNSIVIT